MKKFLPSIKKLALKIKNFKFTKNNLLLIGLLITFSLSIIVSTLFIQKSPSQKETSTFSAIDRICELATLRCYYHNVAELEKQPDGLFKYGLFQYGYKKFWFEYNGIVDVVIDANKVKISKPKKSKGRNIVQVFIPKPEILNPTADNFSMSNPISEKGVFTTIKTEEKAHAFAQAQKTMVENAKNDSNIQYQAYDNAKKIIEQYIINIGKLSGVEYIIEWENDPNNISEIWG